jgi:hypothetical protein
MCKVPLACCFIDAFVVLSRGMFGFFLLLQRINISSPSEGFVIISGHKEFRAGMI